MARTSIESRRGPRGRRSSTNCSRRNSSRASGAVTRTGCAVRSPRSTKRATSTSTWWTPGTPQRRQATGPQRALLGDAVGAAEEEARRRGRDASAGLIVNFYGYVDVYAPQGQIGFTITQIDVQGLLGDVARRRQNSSRASARGTRWRPTSASRSRRCRCASGWSPVPAPRATATSPVNC